MIRRGVADGDLLRIGSGRPSRLSRELAVTRAAERDRGREACRAAGELAVSRGLPVYRRRDEYTG